MTSSGFWLDVHNINYTPHILSFNFFYAAHLWVQICLTLACQHYHKGHAGEQTSYIYIYKIVLQTLDCSLLNY